jgi:hypothetical protein
MTAHAALREANDLSRVFDKRDARYIFAKVRLRAYGAKRLHAIKADGIPVELIAGVNRLLAGEAFLKDYERMFWNEAWLVAKQYRLPQNAAVTMTRHAFAEFVLRDLYHAGMVKALDMASAYDPETGVTLGMFVRARVRQAMHEYMRETVNNVRVPRGQQFSNEISRDAPGMEYLGADRGLGEHTEWEKFVTLLDVGWQHKIEKAIHAAVARGDMPERWGRILDLRFLCEPDQRLTLERAGKLLGLGKSQVHEEQQRAIEAAAALLDPTIRRLRDIQEIFWQANNFWKLWGGQRCGRLELFEERIEQITLREHTPTAPQNVAAALVDREKLLERPDQTDAAYNQVKARTGDPDWQPKAKPRYRRQRLGLLFPCSREHLVETSGQAITDGHLVKCWRMRRWKGSLRGTVVLVDRAAVYRVMRGNKKKLTA